MKELEEKSKQCELQNEEIRKEFEATVDEYHHSKQELAVVNDCLLRINVGVDKLIVLRQLFRTNVS